MKTLLRRLLITLIVLVAIFIVLRALVVPLARQRQGRRMVNPTSIALLPANTERFCLQRNRLRRVPAELLPEARTLFRDRAAAWGLPLDELSEALELKPRWTGEWLCAAMGGGGWILAGPISRMARGSALSLALSAAPDTLIHLPGDWALAPRAHWFVVASQAELLKPESTWLAKQETWLERDDLLLGSDWLEFRAAGEGGALMGAKLMLDRLLCEGLAWSCDRGDEHLAALCPGPSDAFESGLPEGVDHALLPRSGPFDPSGQGMAIQGEGSRIDEKLLSVERRWRGADTAALVRVLSQP